MSSDKRRMARIQGGWASAANPAGHSGGNSAASSAAAGPRHAQHQLVFQPTGQVFREKPVDRIISTEGKFVLSEHGPGNVCSVQLYPDFIADDVEREEIFGALLNGCPWEEKKGISGGEYFKMPRLVSWYGPLPYSFSGAVLNPQTKWLSVLKYLHDVIEEALGLSFNSVLVNLYRDGRDSVAWHSDDELLMGVDPVIASLSFGETRMFEMRPKMPNADEAQYEYVQHVKVPLKDGSLLIMEGETQKYWQHRVPKEYHDKKPRINLTYRTVYNLEEESKGQQRDA